MNELDVYTLKERMLRRELSAEELVRRYLSEIDARDGEIHAYLEVFGERAMAEAKRQDMQIRSGAAGRLAGIPLALKDNILVRGERTTAGSRSLEHYQASYDATVVRKLREEGAIILGKTNLDEFAMGASTENSAFGPTRNPHDRARSPGGSSGGSAAAVAAGMCAAALGSDTGGSIRQPAGFCGVVGLKTTYGRVSRFGLVALASSLDQIGPLARSVRDAELLFSIIAGPDPFDSTTILHPQAGPGIAELKDLVIGVPREYFELKGAEQEVVTSVRAAIAWYEKQGARIEELRLPYSLLGLPAYYVIVPAEASSNLARYDGMRYGTPRPSDELWEFYAETRGEGLGAEPTRRSMIGTYVLSHGYYDAYYKKALEAREVIKEEFRTAFKKVDVLMTPTSPTVAFPLGERAHDPLAMYAADIFTVPANIAGIPAISIPCGTSDNLPIGLQIIAPWAREDMLFSVGKFFEGKNP
jgi:aspartyl-tRNA(Asn)/glutamyl-tRNA(Gln) amidotransferase subunit A